MLFFPLGTDRPLGRTPWLNYALIALNVLVFLVTERSILTLGDQMVQLQESLGAGVQRPDLLAGWNDNLVYTAYLQPGHPRLHQFFTYQFLHQDLWHLGGNMVFLYAFGNAVEDRLGRLPYLMFYLAGGVLAGWAHVLTSAAPVLGASGSVAAVTGIFLALFPQVSVEIWYWFLLAIGRFEVSALVLILFRVGQDLLFNLAGIGNVAYEAHLAGYLTGFLVGLLLLATRLLPGEPTDLLAILEHRRRRAAFARLAASGPPVWDTPTPAPGSETGSGGGVASLPTPAEAERMRARAAVLAKLADPDDPDAAVEAWADLQRRLPGEVLPPGPQLDAANLLMARGRHAEAAAAYADHLDRYPRNAEAPRVALLAALVHARYLGGGARAVELLGPALGKLGGADRELAERVLAEARG